MERLIVYRDTCQFWQDVAPQLKEDEAKNSLLLGLSYLFRRDAGACLYQSALFDGRDLLGALVCSQYLSNRNFVPSPIRAPKVAESIFDGFLSAEIAVTGLVGETTTANAYRDLFQKLGKTIKTHMSQGIYRCSNVVLPKMPDGVKFRIAVAKDAGEIGAWIALFHNEAVPHDPPINSVEVAEDKIKRGQIYVLEKDGRLLSMAGWGRDVETSCSINMVFTPKQLRKHGYASLNTALLTSHFLRQGKLETNLYTDLANPSANKIYQKIGYERVCDSVHFGLL